MLLSPSWCLVPRMRERRFFREPNFQTFPGEHAPRTPSQLGFDGAKLVSSAANQRSCKLCETVKLEISPRSSPSSFSSWVLSRGTEKECSQTLPLESDEGKTHTGKTRHGETPFQCLPNGMAWKAKYGTNQIGPTENILGGDKFNKTIRPKMKADNSKIPHIITHNDLLDDNHFLNIHRITTAQ